jgi:hypothetical protein
MQDLIIRCWSMTPEQRPTFDEIIRNFKMAEFRIVPRADAARLGLYMESIERWEAEAAARTQS